MTPTSTARGTGLESVMDASRIVSEPQVLAKYAIHGIAPGSAAKPESAQEAAEVVRFAATEKLAVIPCGNRTKLDLGAPPLRYDIALDLSVLREIAHYDPADLTLSVDAGFPLAELNATLFQHNQFIPLLTPYYSTSTVGGTIAAGIDSPLRQFYGTARDFLLGAEFIDGTGAQVKSGGRVVKNVTGYDLHKLLIGSLGSLAVITRLNFRTFPAPVAGTCGFVASFSTHEAALSLRRRIVQSPLSPLTLDVLSPGAARIFATRTPLTREVPVFSGENHSAREIPLPLPEDWFDPQHWQVCAAFAGAPEVLDRYTRDLTRFAHDANASSANFLDDSTRPAIWGRLREAIPLFRESSPAASIFRLSFLPGYQAQAITVLQGVANAAGLPLALVARASGTIYLGLLPETPGDSNHGEEINEATVEKLALLTQEIFALVRSRNGDAAMLFVPEALRAMPSVQASQSKISTLAPRIKSAFDPGNIFAPGRRA
jgi:glycolate oxidase FAD binding subunit